MMSSFDLKNNVSIDDIVQTLKANGVVRFPDAKIDVSRMEAELLSLYDKMPESDSYPYGKALRTDQNWNASQTPSIENFFRGSIWMQQVVTRYQQILAGVHRDIFSTYDYKANTDVAPNGWMHFDKLQRVKFFLYLTDVDQECGPLTIAPGTHHAGRNFRLQDNQKNRFGRFYGDDGACPGWSEKQNHHPTFRYQGQELLGTAGTLVIFDSDVLHKGGTISNSLKKRLIVRSHSW